MTRLVRCFLVGIVWLLAMTGTSIASPQNGAVPSVWVMDLKGAVGPATADLFTRALRHANQADARLFVLQLDTPGGLVHSMREMIQAVLDSQVPVAVYVAPQGARAASAGTYLLYSAQIAAMAPATNVGAATPVSIGPSPSPGLEPDKKGQKQGVQSTEQRKQVNDASAYIVSLAELRGRNAEWAEKAVRQAVSITAEEALKANVIDLIADDLPQLLSGINGMKVQVKGAPVTLNLDSYRIHRVQADWRTRFLSVITDPNVAYILLLVGIYGIVFELFNPGIGLAGILGGISLVTALYAFHLLPISYAGLGLIALGLGLMIAEALTPTLGILGVGGAASFLLGSVMLMDTEVPAYQIALPVILALAVVSLAMIWMMVSMALKSRKQRIVSGEEGLIGEKAIALENFSSRGRVQAHGETWHAISAVPVKKGQLLTVTGVEGLTLKVEIKP